MLRSHFLFYKLATIVESFFTVILSFIFFSRFSFLSFFAFSYLSQNFQYLRLLSVTIFYSIFRKKKIILYWCRQRILLKSLIFPEKNAYMTVLIKIKSQASHISFYLFRYFIFELQEGDVDGMAVLHSNEEAKSGSFSIRLSALNVCV